MHEGREGDRFPETRRFAPEHVRELRARIGRVREENRSGWEASKRLVNPSVLPQALGELVEKIGQSPLARPLRESLAALLRRENVGRVSELSAIREELKELTGLPATKAIRALCLAFGVATDGPGHTEESEISFDQVVAALDHTSNPYDVLLAAPQPSLLDIGAGDLTFEQELVDRYVPRLPEAARPLVLHAVDRLEPGSHVGGVYHVDPRRLEYLTGISKTVLQFRFWGGVDCRGLATLQALLPTYTVVTCHAPANPTFAYEPTRLSPRTIHSHLEATKGEFRKRRLGGEEVLEVRHEGRALTFPAWKFEVVGPLTLLNLMLERGALGILSAIDGEVFWETLAQLLAEDRYRPSDVIFTPGAVKDIFHPLYARLSELPYGGRIRLSAIAEVRATLPQGISRQEHHKRRYRLRDVEIRRGAAFEGVPSSFTARQYVHMKDEATPWWIILIPEIYHADGG